MHVDAERCARTRLRDELSTLFNQMEDYAIVCPGCKSEMESIPVPGEPFSFVKFIIYFAQIFIISILIAVFMDSDWVLILGIIHGYDKAKAIPDSIRYV